VVIANIVLGSNTDCKLQVVTSINPSIANSLDINKKDVFYYM